MAIRVLTIICIALLMSCGSSSNANSENWKEHTTYKAVKKHYLSLGEEEKLEATDFLFSNIAEQYSLNGSIFGKYDRFFNLLDSYNRSGISKRIDKYSNKLLPELEKQWHVCASNVTNADYVSVKKVYDNSSLTPQFFIQQIDEAFDAWKNHTWSQHVSFDHFCEYILPYKVFNERPENWRSPLSTKYAWVDIDFKGSTDPIPIADTMNKEIGSWFKFSQLFYQYPFDQNYTRLMKGQVGGCSHMVTIATYALRSKGIPCAVDFAPQYGNRSLGHTWNVVFDENMEAIPFNGASGDWLKMGFVFHKQSLDVKIPKVYRKTFAKQVSTLTSIVDPKTVPSNLIADFRIDVTAEYMPVSDFTIRSDDPSQKIMYLCTFNNKEWIPVAWSEIVNGIAVFKNMGRDLVYLPAYYVDKKVVPAEKPIILHTNGDLELIQKHKGRAQSAKLFDKYPPSLTGEGDTTNAILPGDDYELFFWDNEWVSLGVSNVAIIDSILPTLGFDYKKTMFFADINDREFLFYENVPVGTLFLLRNHSRGKEERIFTIEDSHQIWW